MNDKGITLKNAPRPMSKENDKYSKIAILISAIALCISVVSLYVTWQSFIISNRPYLKIEPVKYENTDKFFVITKNNDYNYTIMFKFRISNTGKVPANKIHGQCVVIVAQFPDIKEYKNKASYRNPMLPLYQDSGYINHDAVSRLIKETPDENMKNFLEEFQAKDIHYAVIFRGFKAISIFPGDYFEFEGGVELSGRDSGWFVEHIERFMQFIIECAVTYRGIMQWFGRPYYSAYNADLINGKMIPYEIHNY